MVIFTLFVNFLVSFSRLFTTFAYLSSFTDKAKAAIGAAIYLTGFIVRLDLPIDYVAVNLVNFLICHPNDVFGKKKRTLIFSSFLAKEISFFATKYFWIYAASTPLLYLRLTRFRSHQTLQTSVVHPILVLVCRGHKLTNFCHHSNPLITKSLSARPTYFSTLLRGKYLWLERPKYFKYSSPIFGRTGIHSLWTTNNRYDSLHWKCDVTWRRISLAVKSSHRNEI